jgi:hypothetical protein
MRSSTDALMWEKSVMEKVRQETLNTALIVSNLTMTFPGTQLWMIVCILAPLVGLTIFSISLI